VATIAGDLRREHRELDTMLGRFLAAADAGQVPAALEAIAAFDDALRRHTAVEEERVFGPPAGPGLVAPEGETVQAKLSRELRLEHVQIREVSGMMRRLVEADRDLPGARRLFPNLARRWDAHTEREERELFPPEAPGS
jgi:Hemerythrin HHE cation binding domain